MKEISMNMLVLPTKDLLYQKMPHLAKAKENGTFRINQKSYIFMHIFPLGNYFRASKGGTQHKVIPV